MTKKDEYDIVLLLKVSFDAKSKLVEFFILIKYGGFCFMDIVLNQITLFLHKMNLNVSVFFASSFEDKKHSSFCHRKDKLI